MANTLNRISKVMGESFKIHSQALVGHEDDVVTRSSASTPTMPSQGMVDLEMENPF